MSSTSEQKFQNEKSPKKKYEKSKTSQKVCLPSVETKNSEEISFGFFSSNDFPELKVPEKFPSGNKNFEPKNTQWGPAVSNDKLCKSFAALSGSKNVTKGEVDLITKERQFMETVGENNSAGTNKGKKASPKKAPIQVQRNPNKKKRADPIFINFQDILAINKVQRKTKQQNIFKNNTQRFRDKELLSGNLLDSSNPKRNRGKHRENKKKKLSNFKTIIIKERILKQKLKEKQVEDSQFGNDCFSLIDTIDFKTEINSYLNELNKKNLKSVNVNSNKLEEDKSTNTVLKQNEESVKAEFVEKTEEVSEKVKTVKEKKIFPVTAEGEIRFSSKFREYCDNIITPELNTAVTKLIIELINLQDRQFSRDPMKAKTRKRHVSGIREVKKYLTLKKVKMIIIAPNLEKLQMEGSVYDSVSQLKTMAESQNVPYGFALDRYKLGRCTKKNVQISAFAVLNYEGLETLYGNVLSELREAKRKFSELTPKKKEEEEEEEEKEKEEKVEKVNDINFQVISSLMSAFREGLRMCRDVETPLN